MQTVQVKWDSIARMWIVVRYHPDEFIWKVDSCHGTKDAADEAANSLSLDNKNH